VPINLKGYQYLKDSIDLAYLGKRNIKDLYEILSDTYNTSSKNIERSIRNAIEVSWNRANLELITKVFGKTLSIEKDRPTNSEYIYTLYEFIKLID
jgi:two-component system, response regulator, stage 0 sporulation protein A